MSHRINRYPQPARPQRLPLPPPSPVRHWALTDDRWDYFLDDLELMQPLGFTGTREANSISRLVPPSPPIHTFMDPWPVLVPEREESRLTQDEQKKALKNLKKEIYNPMPKKISRRLNLYYREDSRHNFIEKEKERDDDGKRCAICLEDFEPREEVTLTPCNHMFHEDCIVPWVKNHGKCPVCRSAIYERGGESALSINNNNPADMNATNFLIMSFRRL
ncbi:uncharacterized protein LOC131148735 [Malania oleifera]|uniref:uncharacterized protein LOC131148735 n=1 Tax=Malania oleifera TaxID=397392 RepID=UPI0025AE9E70|nr:uncharacterized protein LOC131148735 [Malania oleifera]